MLGGSLPSAPPLPLRSLQGDAGDGSISVSWLPPQGAGLRRVSYIVYCDSSSAACPPPALLSSSGAVHHSFTVANDLTYRLRVEVGHARPTA